MPHRIYLPSRSVRSPLARRAGDIALSFLIAGIIVLGFTGSGAMTGGARAGDMTGILNQCQTRKVVGERLQQKYGQIPSAAGKLVTPGIMEVFVAPDRSWTLVITDPSGLACMMSSGQAWTADPPPLSGRGS